MKSLLKLLRFTSIYGISRTFNKAMGRLRKSSIKKMYFTFPQKQNISIIGCGQFAFSCIAYFLAKKRGKVFLNFYDIEKSNQNSLANYYKGKGVNTVDELLNNPQLEILYIASNHATHTPYVVRAMNTGIKKIQIEKPVSTSYEQFVELIYFQRKYKATLYSGYNRPNSKAIKLLRTKTDSTQSGAFSINYFISGHLIGDDHWYRNPEEGTRICGNMGHWIDLSVHILAWRKLPTQFNIQITYSNLEESDDNITVNLTSEKGDLISMMLTSRTEPFEGINETVNFQYQDTIAKIDDFREITIWKGSQLSRKKFFPKDVGHQRTVLQPFHSDEENRNWSEVVLSTLIMLHITDMVRKKQKESVFDVNSNLNQLEKDVLKYKIQ